MERPGPIPSNTSIGIYGAVISRGRGRIFSYNGMLKSATFGSLFLRILDLSDQDVLHIGVCVYWPKVCSSGLCNKEVAMQTL